MVSDQQDKPLRLASGKTREIEISDEVAEKLREIDPDPNIALRKLMNLATDSMASAG